MPKAAEEEEAQVPANLEQTSVTAVEDEIDPEDIGMGVSTRAEDNLVPLIYILQAQSPQCNKRSPSYVEMAEAGSIWLRNSNLPAISGEEGILFQPCYFHIDWVEWIPRSAGGGFVARHDRCPADAVEKPDPQNPKKTKKIRPNGNEMVETRYHTGFVILGDMEMPYVIPMTSSGHSISRGWTGLMGNMRAIVAGQRVKSPSFGWLYRMKTRSRTNAAGTWFTWDIQPERQIVKSNPLYAMGKSLALSFASGEKQVDVPEEHFAETDPDSAPM